MAVPYQVQKAADMAEEKLKKQSDVGDTENVDDIDNESQGKEGELQPETHSQGETEAPQELNNDSGEIERLERENKALTSLNKSLDNENRHLKIKCGDYERQIKELKDNFDRKKKEEEERNPEPVNFTSAERELLESEGISDDVIKLLLSKVKPVEKKQDPDYDNLRQETETVKKDTEALKKERFYERLSAAVSDWEDVNKDKEFLARLSEKVPYQNYTYQELMNHAANNYDSAIVAKIFKDLRPIKEDSPKRKTLEDLAEPPAKRGTERPKKDADKWDPKKISEFYRGIRNNPTKYTPEQIQEIERKHINR